MLQGMGNLLGDTKWPLGIALPLFTVFGTQHEHVDFAPRIKRKYEEVLPPCGHFMEQQL